MAAAKQTKVQAPPALALHVKKPGIHHRIVERMTGERFAHLPDPVEKYETLYGYTVASDPTKRMVRIECPESEFLARQKERESRGGLPEKTRKRGEDEGQGGFDHTEIYQDFDPSVANPFGD